MSSSTCVLLPGRSVCNVAPSRLSAALQDFYLGGAIRLFHNVTCTGGSREGDLYPRYRGASPLFEMTSSASSTSSSPPKAKEKKDAKKKCKTSGKTPDTDICASLEADDPLLGPLRDILHNEAPPVQMPRRSQSEQLPVPLPN